jgi:hypothetical protein
MHPEPLNSAADARVGSTGDARVDAAVAGLAGLDEVDLADRPAVLEAVHDRLREILGELGDAGRPGHGGQPHSGQGQGGQAHSGQAHSGQAHSGQDGDPRP